MDLPFVSAMILLQVNRTPFPFKHHTNTDTHKHVHTPRGKTFSASPTIRPSVFRAARECRALRDTQTAAREQNSVSVCADTEPVKSSVVSCVDLTPTAPHNGSENTAVGNPERCLLNDFCHFFAFSPVLLCSSKHHRTNWMHEATGAILKTGNYHDVHTPKNTHVFYSIYCIIVLVLFVIKQCGVIELSWHTMHTAYTSQLCALKMQ